MMNFPGVLSKDPEVMAKIAIAKKLGKPIDGHAPGLTGGSARAYAEAGMTTDHECTTSVEARDKLEVGMKIIIREGSAAKNFDALINLIRDYPSQIMFCSDDKHPNDLVVGHIDQLVRRALALEFNPIDVLRAATLNPIRHYGLDVGLLQLGDSADFIVVDSLRSFSVLSTFIGGVEVARLGDSMLPHRTSSTINNFQLNQIQAAELEVLCGSTELRAIEVIDGQLLTNCAVVPSRQHLGRAISDPDQDLLKLVVCNRYQSAPLSIAFVKGFGLRAGALASSVAHDSHNLIAVGVDDLSIARALQMVAGSKGGIAAVGPAGEKILPLPVAGLMSIEDGYEVAQAYEAIDRFAKSLGSSLQAPFMTLSFLALPVIPRLKLTDKGLFDSDEFDFVPIFV